MLRQRFPGEIVATGWMIASVIAIAVFTAGITSTLTRRELQGAVHSFNDLRSVRVGAVANSPTTDYFTRQQLSFRAFQDAQSGLSALSRGEIDAFVHDKPLLAWIVRNDFQAPLGSLIPASAARDMRSVLPKGSALRPMLDLAVLDQDRKRSVATDAVPRPLETPDPPDLPRPRIHPLSANLEFCTVSIAGACVRSKPTTNCNSR